MDSQEFYSILLDWLNLSPDEVCTSCGGRGRKAYGSTTTWRGGIGGQAITEGVCDKCWGSGSKDRPNKSHRLIENEWRLLKHQRDDALKMLEEMAGALESNNLWIKDLPSCDAAYVNNKSVLDKYKQWKDGAK